MTWPWARKQPEPVQASPSVGVATSTRSWDNPWGNVFGSYVPLSVDYAVYDAIREGLPLVDTAMRKLARLCAGFNVTSDNEATAEAVNTWLRDMRVLSLCRGMDTLEYAFVNSLLQYGKGALEVVLTENGRDVYQVTTVSAKRIRLVIQPDKSVALGEMNRLGEIVAYPRQELFAYAALNVEGDSPQGVSLLRSLPFVANLLLIVENALRQNWQRQGAPAFLLLDKIDPSTLGMDTSAGKRTTDIKTQWNTAMRKRWEQQGVMDFVLSTQGDFSITTIGADGTPLEFPQTYRAIVEQIVAATELAPFMLGLQWSTTERLSQQQADMIVSTINAVRDEVEACYLLACDWWQRLNGLKGKLAAQWSDVSLQDMVESANADLASARAANERMRFAQTSWANGFTDQQGAAEIAGFDAPVSPLDAPVVLQNAGTPAPPGGG